MDIIELGDRAKDAITGITGIVIAKTFWLNGCIRSTIQPEEAKDGKPVDSQTIDDAQLRLAKKRVQPAYAATLAPAPPAVAPPARRPAGPRPEPTRNATPSR